MQNYMNKKLIRKKFREDVFSRDDYHCVTCGAKGIDRQANPVRIVLVFLDAHHIIDRNNFPNGGYVKENGITLCDICHKKAEKYHQTNGADWEFGFHPNDLFKLIKSSKEAAFATDLLNNS